MEFGISSSARTVLRHQSNPFGVSIYIEKENDGKEKSYKLTAMPNCCIGPFKTVYEGEDDYRCNCGKTFIYSEDWFPHFYLVPHTAEILHEWVEEWTGLKNVTAEVEWK